jgi:hypothetical protein
MMNQIQMAEGENDKTEVLPRVHEAGGWLGRGGGADFVLCYAQRWRWCASKETYMDSVNRRSAGAAGAPAGARAGGLAVVGYVLVFGAFVLVNMLAPRSMEATALFLGGERELPLWGLNAAVLFGAILVGTAVVLAVAELLGES